MSVSKERKKPDIQRY